MRIFLAALLLMPLIALGETAYVTDTLKLGFHHEPDTSDKPAQMLDSGQSLEVLSRDRNYAYVRLPNGTEGYVKTAYLVNDKPAKLIVAETQAENARLTGELKELRASFAQPAAAIAALKKDAADLQQQLATSKSRNDELQADNERFVERQALYRRTLPYQWAGAAILVCLLGGFLAGMWFLDYRIRRRHGGMRIV